MRRVAIRTVAWPNAASGLPGHANGRDSSRKRRDYRHGLADALGRLGLGVERYNRAFPRFPMAGRPALQARESGQVRKEAATAKSCKCRDHGSPPTSQGRTPFQTVARPSTVLHLEMGARPYNPAMSYQVLARKWRPATFAELSGQEHVVTALTNSLSRGRLHHAYLLTGTRGVGKTTIARILAKSLNCVTGVTATPCGVCDGVPRHRRRPLRRPSRARRRVATPASTTCARSSTTRATRRPSGRYKVYLIDEVHMLSKAAFNSMLKTLEEPPEHVRFVLATTDPQKIPVTVLSRCLQFNLKPLAPPRDRRAPRVHPDAGRHRARRRRGGAHRARRARVAARRLVAARPGHRLRRRRSEGRRRSHDARHRRSRIRLSHRRRAGGRRRPGAARRERCARRARACRPRWRSRSWRRSSIASRWRRSCPTPAKAFDDAERLAGYAARFSRRDRAALLPDRDAGPRRPRARARRGDRRCDDAAAHARVRARQGRRRPSARRAVERAAAAPRGVAPERPRRPSNVASIAPRRAAQARRSPRSRRARSCRCPTIPRRWPAFVAQLKLTGWPRNSRRRPSSSRGRQRVDARAARGVQAPRRQGVLGQAQGRARAGDRAQAAARIRGRARRRSRRWPPPRSASAREASAKREAAFRDEPFVRDLAGQVRRPGAQPTPSSPARDGEPKRSEGNARP